MEANENEEDVVGTRFDLQDSIHLKKKNNNNIGLSSLSTTTTTSSTSTQMATTNVPQNENKKILSQHPLVGALLW